MTQSLPDSTRVFQNGPAETSHNSAALSLVIPCYNVETYLPVMLTSLDLQDCTPSSLEVIFVVDGSPDACEEIINQWMKTAPFRVTLAVQENQGVAGALNTGLGLAQAELVSFAGPDDQLSHNYSSEIVKAAADHPDIQMFVTRMIRTTAEGERRSHPLDFKFSGVEENTIINMGERPEMIHLHAGMAAFRRKTLEELSLEFNPLLRQGFEDAHFIAKLMLQVDEPNYLIVAQAHYFYVVRADSLTAIPDYSKYIGLCQNGYLDLLDLAGTQPPTWLGSLILYDLYWLFRQYSNIQSPVFTLTADETELLHSLTRQVLSRISLTDVRAFRVVNTPLDVRASWEAASANGVETQIAVARAFDPARGLQKVVFHSHDPFARAKVFHEGNLLEVPFHKAREILFFDKVWMYEHIYWVAVGTTEIDPSALTFVAQTRGLEFVGTGRVFTAREAGRFLEKTAPAAPKVDPPRLPGLADVSPATIKRRKRRIRNRRSLERLQYSIAYRAGAFLGWRKNFSNAWVLIDRNIQANDNAEALYRYLRAERPDINAWFVINKDSPDFKRLKNDGFRLVSHHSKKHFVLMKEARVLASSMIDHYVVKPFPWKHLPQTWLYSFLQHGVTKERLHRWWNVKHVDHLVTSTTAEHRSLVSDPGPYKLSDREVTLTGMPRHDRLFRLTESAKANPSGITRVVLMPTWRNYLMGAAKGAEREQREGFYQSSFVVEWSAFLNSHYLAELATNPDVDIVLLPHPGIDSHWSDLQLPTGMRRMSYIGDDVQELLAGADLVVTDYSSQAFEGAFCGAPTVYFQFDREEFFSAGHIGSPGYFDYFQDGFGPVCENRESLEMNLGLMLSGAHPELPSYKQRISDLYPLRDDKACERVVSEIELRLSEYVPSK